MIKPKKREKIPEKWPFRLTRMLVKSLEACGIEGNYRNNVSNLCNEKENKNNDENIDQLGGDYEKDIYSFLQLFYMKHLANRQLMGQKQIDILAPKDSAD